MHFLLRRNSLGSLGEKGKAGAENGADDKLVVPGVLTGAMPSGVRMFFTEYRNSLLIS